MPKWTDDDGKPIKAASAEQHALDNPNHVVEVFTRELTDDGKFVMLVMTCEYDVLPENATAAWLKEHPTGECGWWDEQGIRV